MKPDITTATARARGYLDRRQFLRSASFAIGGGVLGSVVGQAILDPILEPVAEPIREALYGRRLVETYRATPLSMARLETHGNRQQQVALEAWRLNAPLPEPVKTKATMTYAGPDGSQWVDWQGEDASRRLWGREHPRNVPMRDQPDPEFGTWAEKRIRAFRDAEEPALMRVSGRVGRPDGDEVEQSYSILMLPYRDGRVLTTAAAWPDAPRASAECAPTSCSRAHAGRGQPRSASI